MKKVLKAAGVILAGIVGLILLVALGLVIYGETQFKKVQNRPVYELAADSSPEGIARGEYLVRIMGCTDCHTGRQNGARFLAGNVEDVTLGPVQAVFAVPNLTQDVETGLGGWTDAEIARAIREGIDREGRELVVMPSFNYHVMSDADIAALIGYLRTLEPVNNPVPPLSANTIGKIMTELGMMGPSPVGTPITEHQEAPQAGTVAYGGYLVSLGGCRDCHGMELIGGIPPLTPDGPPAPDLTPAGNLSGWQEADFIRTLRTGITPEGRSLDPNRMPWPVYSQMTDDDLRLVFSFLQTLPTRTASK